MNHRRRALTSAAFTALGSLGLASPWLAMAQASGANPSRVITPFPAGSGPDAALRLVADKLSKKWGKTVIVDNKAGGNGFIAVAAFKQGAADGNDLIQLDSNQITTHPHTFSKLPYNVERDFTPLRMILRTPFFVTVAADSPYKSIDDIVAAAKAGPGKVSYGSWFNGSPGHIGALRLAAMKNLDMLHVPFRDFGQLYAAVANKEVDWALGSVASAGAMERAGKIRFIAVAASARDPLYPQVPATAEIASVRGFEVSAWAGLFGPRATSPAQRDRLSADIGAALQEPEVVERYKMLGYEAPALDAVAFAELIRRETASWADVIKTSGLRLD